MLIPFWKNIVHDQGFGGYAVVHWGYTRVGYTPYTNLQVFLTAYTHLSDHK